MIIVKLKGGLGNQMFQYALGRCLAEKNKDKLFFDITQLLDRTPRDIVFRDYNLDIFNINPQFTFLSKVARLLPVPLVWFGASYFVSKIKNIIGIQNYIKENINIFNRSILDLKGDVYLDGYWQSEKYFKEIEDIIRKDFTFEKKLSKKAQDLAEKIDSSNSVCLNVRRGEFVSSPSASKLHGFVGVEYYNKGIDVIISKIENPHFFIFSDDIEWCMDNLKLKYPHTFVSHDYLGEKYGEYLHLMTLCKNFLVSNSTFSWWAAWLSRYQSKIVIAPKKWFKDSSINSEDLIPQSWIRV